MDKYRGWGDKITFVFKDKENNYEKVISYGFRK